MESKEIQFKDKRIRPCRICKKPCLGRLCRKCFTTKSGTTIGRIIQNRKRKEEKNLSEGSLV